MKMPFSSKQSDYIMVGWQSWLLRWVHATSRSFGLSSSYAPHIPNEILEEILKEAWLQQYMVHRWRFYRAMLCVNRRWEAIMRALALRYVIVESPTDLMNYHRIVGELKEKIQDEAVLLHFFSRTHIRVVINALVLPPMLPACRSIEVTHGNTLYKRDDDIISLTDPSLAPWLQIPHLQAVAFLQSRVAVKSSSGGSGEPSYQASVPPTLTYIHDHNSITSQNLRALTCLSHITQLRVSFPRPLIDFVGHVPNLEVLILDLTYGLVDRHYTTVAALKAGLFRKKKRLLILNTGPVQPTYFQTAVKKVCEQQKIMLERRIVYYDVDRTKYLFPDDRHFTFPVPTIGMTS